MAEAATKRAPAKRAPAKRRKPAAAAKAAPARRPARRPGPSIAPVQDRTAGDATPILAPLRDVGPISRYQAAVTKTQTEFALELSRIQMTFAREVATAAKRATAR